MKSYTVTFSATKQQLPRSGTGLGTLPAASIIGLACCSNTAGVSAFGQIRALMEGLESQPPPFILCLLGDLTLPAPVSPMTGLAGGNPRTSVTTNASHFGCEISWKSVVLRVTTLMPWCGWTHTVATQSFLSREQSQADNKTHTMCSFSVMTMLRYKMIYASFDVENRPPIPISPGFDE